MLAFLAAFVPPRVVESQIKNPKLIQSERKIPNRYIVVLEDWAAGPRGLFSRADEVAWELGIVYEGRVDRVYRHAINGFVVEMNHKQAAALSRDSRVKFVEEDAEMSINAVQSNPTWGLDRIDQRYLPVSLSYQYDATGAGVRAYIIDSGIRSTHNDFGGRVSGGFSSINDGRGTNDCNGHGTHVAGTTGGEMWGVAKNVSIIPVRVLDCQGNGPTSGVIAGVDWVTANHVKPAVANMSLGGGASSSLDFAVSNSINAGVTYVVAAGNDNKNACSYSPARVAGAITVGSATISDVRSSFSNFGSCLDLFAPGSSIKSAGHTSNGASTTISGTSMASPHVAGTAALYLQVNPDASPTDVANAIIGNATVGVLSGVGTGSANLLLYSLFDGTPPDPVPTPTLTPVPSPSLSPIPSLTPIPSPSPTLDPNVRANYARPQNGGSATASSGLAAAAIDGNRVWALGGSWKDEDPFIYPDWIEIDLGGLRMVDEINIYGVRDDFLNVLDPTESTISTIYGIVNFNVQYWDGSGWSNVPGGNITGNTFVLRRLIFSPITTTKIRVVVEAAHDGYSRIVELEAWGGGTPPLEPSPTPTVAPSPTPTIAPSPIPSPVASPTATPVPSPTPLIRENVALASNGGVASASTALSSPNLAIDGIRSWALSGAWKDLTQFVYPDWMQVDFSGPKTIDEITIYGVRDDYLNTSDPTDSTISTIYGIVNFDVQYWNGSGWATVPGGSVTGNNLVVRKFTFSPVTTSSIRVVINSAHDGYSRIVELEAWGGESPEPQPSPSPTPPIEPSPNPTSTPVASPTATPVPSPTPLIRENVALASNGGVASASTALSSPSVAIDGVRSWIVSGAWKDLTQFIYPDWMQVDFSGPKVIDEITIYGVRDDYLNASDPTGSTISTIYGIVDFDVQYWNGSGWATVPGGNVTGNNLVVRKFAFSPITTSSIRVVINSAHDGYSRIVELEAWGGGSPDIEVAALPVYGYEIVNTYPHDPQAFTQGLLYHGGFLYESTGREGQSTLRKVEIQTGNVIQKFDLPNDNFGEGIAIHNGNIYQLTWLNQIGRVFKIDDFKVIGGFTYQGNGWGLTSDGVHMFMTDGTNVIRVLDPTSFMAVRTIEVMREDGKPLRHLNELEYVNGEIWANIWASEKPEILGKPNHIARIDPANGKLLGWINLDGISPEDVERDLSNTLNGIAYDAEGDRIFVTGKNWTKLFEIKLTSPS